MSRATEHTRTPHASKENRPMPRRRLASLAAALGAAVLLLAILPIASASAASPWWQVLTGSRPSNMWEPSDNVQRIESQKDPESGVLAAKIEVNGSVIGCLGAGSYFGVFSADEVCQLLGVAAEATETAVELEALLEGAFGTSAVEVSGGPAGGEPFTVTTPGRPAPPITVSAEFPGIGSFGTAKAKVLSPGGSGRLLLTLTNLGDAPVDGSSDPVRIVDHLPAGVAAYEVEAVAGVFNAYGPVDCALEASDEVACDYEGSLPPFEAIEVEINASLLGSPPAVGSPGEVTVSGGGAPAVSTEQKVKLSPEPTPYGFEHFEAQAEEEGGQPTAQAGAHPFQFTSTVQLNSGPMVPTPRPPAAVGGRSGITEQPAMPRNFRFPLPPGQVGNATVVPQCSMAQFFTSINFVDECSDDTAIGVASVTVIEPIVLGLMREAVPVFNLPPAHGEPARFGFFPAGVPVIIDTELDPGSDNRIVASIHNTTQVPQFLAGTVSFWGTPGDPRHDSSRGWGCVYVAPEGRPCERPADESESAFLRMPVSCSTPLEFGAETEPWNVPVGSVIDSALVSGDPLRGCNKVPFDPGVSGAPTSKLAENPSGFDFQLTMPNSGLLNGEGVAEGEAKKVEFTLPEGMSVNPSDGEGLVGCTEAEYARETAGSTPGEGCPDASKIGTVDVTTPLLHEEAHGALYIATPHQNPSGSLIALYMVARIPERGILIKQAGKVDADPRTGQLTTTFDDLPQLPYSSFHLHFREGGRAPLVTPPACGTYQAEARFVPWSAQDPNNPAPDEIIRRTVSFQVQRGVDGGACPRGATPPFHPGLQAGTLNNAAARFSPFDLRLTRNDGEQEFTHFSIKLPPGVVGKLAGIPPCPDAAIAAAKARTGPSGGQEELDSPSCPTASEIGHTLVGAGVGPILTYVPGKVYLAGPYHGDPLSLVAITAAKVGPFDLGTVVLRDAFEINPETGEVFVDATGSDPIPHIVQGIPTHARDVRVYVDRPEFVLNPSDCTRTQTASTVLGSGLDFASEADDNPITVSTPFQAADCAALPFGPKLALKLLGGTKRGSHPAFQARLRMHGIGEAAIERAQVTLPKSEFIENSHFDTICTRVQFKAGAGNGAQCPAGSVYGHAKAITPLLSEPLEGPVFLRSSEHKLPDLVVALSTPGGIHFDLVGRVDSVKGGGIRNTFEAAPDAPVTEFLLTMQGGDKGLFVNSTDVCLGKHRAEVKLDAHNGKVKDSRPALKASRCAKARKARKRHG